jgi:hypothetical protein
MTFTASTAMNLKMTTRMLATYALARADNAHDKPEFDWTQLFLMHDPEVYVKISRASE